ncbi:GntR family transcriptional regulator [Candidatus Sumerlaeota bacterium]|nr:GntR family transcriptional regulator [Candidatus Sumerlaeota bacterium]
MVKRPKASTKAYKYARIKTELSIQIFEGQLRPHDRVPSLTEITQKYKVSKITARRVLNDLAMEGLVYTSRGRGTFVADAALRQDIRQIKNAANQLGVVFGHGAGLFMSDIILGVDEEAFSRKTQINLCLSNNSYEREAENLHRLVKQGIDKIILFIVIDNNERTVNPNIPLYLRLQERGIRILLLACRIPNSPIPAVTFDDYNAFRRLVRFMKDKNCKRLVYVTRTDNASTSVERLQGFKDGLLENQLPYTEHSIVRVRYQSFDSVVSDSYQYFSRFLKTTTVPDAVLCSDEMIAAGVFNALEKADLPARARPIVGGMGSYRNLHVLKGNPYVLLENDTHRLGREATAVILSGELPYPGKRNTNVFHRLIPVPLRVPKVLK